MLRFRHSVLVLLLLSCFRPSPVLGQGERAGVVTTLQGTVTAARSTASQPVPLRFKDDVYLQDRVTTGDQSIARILLGGKALVTIRERSVLTITEIPGRATVSLESGKVGLAVAREKMRPGEAIDVRTANAIAAVRGTVLVVEVQRASAQVGGASPTVVSTITVVSDPSGRGVDVTRLNPATGAVVGVPTNVAALQSVRAAGVQPLTVAPVLPAQVGVLVSDLQTSPAPQPETQAPVVAAQVQTAVVLSNALLGDPQQVVAPTTTTPSAIEAATTPESETEQPEILPGNQSPAEEASKLAPPDVPDVDISGTVTLGPGEALHRFSGSTTRTSTAPVVRVQGSVTAQETLIQVDPGAVVSLASPLLDVVDSTLVTPSAVLGVQGSISSSSPAPFLFFDPTTVTAASVIAVLGGTLSVAGPLIQAIDTAFVLSSSVLDVVDGATVTKTGGAAAIQILGTVPHGSTVTAGENVIALRTTAPVPAVSPTLSLAGPLLETVNAFVAGGGLGPRALLFIGDGAVLTKTDATPLLSFTDSTIPNQGPIVSLRRSPSLTVASTLNLGAAPLLEATGSSLGSVSPVPLGGSACCSGFFVGQGAQLLATGAGPLIRLTGSTFDAGASGTPGGNFFVMLDDCPGCGDPFLAPTLVSIAGPLLDATDTPITTLFNLVSIGRSTLIGTGGEPLVRLTNTADRTYSFGGNDPISSTLAFGGFLNANGATGGSHAPTTVTLAGPLLHTTNTGGRTAFTTTGDFLAVVNGAQVTTTTTTAPLITSDHSTFTVGSLANRRSFVGVGGTGGATGAELARLSLRAPLLSATNDVLDISSNVFTLFRSGAVIDTAVPSGQALLQFSNSTVTSTTAGIATMTGFSGGTSTLTLARPLLSAIDTAITAATGLFRLFDGAQATSTATAPFVHVSGGTLATGAAGPGTGGVFRMQSAVGQNPTSFTIADGFLSATDGAVLSAEGQNGFVTVRNAAVLTSTGAAPFLDFHGASASAGQDMIVIGPFVVAGAVPPTVTLAGPLFRARDTGSPITFATGTGPVTGVFLNINDGAVVTKTGGLPLLELIGTAAPDRVVLALSREIFFLTTGVLGQPAPTTLTLAGPLLSAVNARIAVGNPAAGPAFTSFRLGGDAILTKTDATPLIDLVSTNLVSAGRVLEMVRFLGPAQAGPVLALGAAPLLRATGSNISTSSTGAGFACCSGFELGSAAQLTATGTAPLIQLTNTTFNAGADGVSGQHFFDLADLGGGAPATLAIAGPLLSAIDSTLTALGSGLQVFQSNLTSTATDALMQFTSTVNRTIAFGGTNPFTSGQSPGNVLRIVASASDPFNASVTLNGPLLSTTNTGPGARTTFDTKGDFIAVLTGARLASNTALPFVSSTNSVFNVGVPAGGRFLLVSGNGGEFGEGPEGARAVFSGPLLASTSDGLTVQESFVEASDLASVVAAGLTPFLTFTGSTLNAKSFAALRTGGTITLDAPLATVDAAGVAPSTLAALVVVESGGFDVSQLTTSFVEPLVQFSGPSTGPHLLAPDASPFRAMFDIRGLDFAIFDPDLADPDVPVFTLGTLTPIQHASELFRGDSGTQVQTKQLVSLDTALFDASKPLMNLRNGSSLTSTNDLINLLLKAHLNATLVPGDALVTLNASTLTINNGSLLNLTGASFARVTGDLVRLDNSSTLNILNGNLVTVSNGSMFKLTGGSLGSFGTGTNTINITNNAACGGCSVVALPGITNGVLLRNGALAGNVIVQGGFVPFANLGGANAVNISGTSGAVIVLDGSTSKVKLGP